MVIFPKTDRDLSEYPSHYIHTSQDCRIRTYALTSCASCRCFISYLAAHRRRGGWKSWPRVVLHNTMTFFYPQHMLTGQVIVISFVLFFAIASYAILLSPFLPLTGFLVCPTNPISSLFWPFLVLWCPSERHVLQVFCLASYTHYLILRHLELGGMAILPQFIIVRKRNTLSIQPWIKKSTINTLNLINKIII